MQPTENHYRMNLNVYRAELKRVPQAAHCQRCLVPLTGMTGMKKSVTKSIPFLSTNCPTVPHLLQRICSPVSSLPHVTKRTPMTKKKNN
jgi:hypothetical protein